jgi:hypothetical protein
MVLDWCSPLKGTRFSHGRGLGAKQMEKNKMIQITQLYHSLDKNQFVLPEMDFVGVLLLLMCFPRLVL